MLLVALAAGILQGRAPQFDVRKNIKAVEAYWKGLESQRYRGVGLVAQNGRIAFVKSCGGIKPDATFYIGGIAKSFTDIATLSLVGYGKILLTDTLGAFFPSSPAARRGVTIEQLLLGAARLGSADGGTAAGISDRSSAVSQILGFRRVDGALRSPRGVTDDDTAVLAAELEVCSGKPWQKIVRDEALDSAGLKHTFFVGDRDPTGDYAFAPGKAPMPEPADWGLKGGAGMFSTARDLFEFVRRLEGGDVLDKPELKLANEYRSEVTPDDGLTLAFHFADVPNLGPRLFAEGWDMALDQYATLEYFTGCKVTLILLSACPTDLAVKVRDGFIATATQTAAGNSTMALVPAPRSLSNRSEPK